MPKMLVLSFFWHVGFDKPMAVADPGGGVRGFKPPLQRLVFVFFCLSVYENSHGPGP